MVEVTFQNHFYRWKRYVHKQAKGGPIGLRATGVCAKVVMNDWIEKFRGVLESNGVKIFTLTKYVDDVMIICQNLKLGQYWNGREIVYSESVKRKHMDSQMSREKLTLDVLIQVAESIHDFLKFTGECSQNGKPIACLDTQIWTGIPDPKPWYMGANNAGKETPAKVEVPLYCFYKKEVSPKIGTLNRSAIPEK